MGVTHFCMSNGVLNKYISGPGEGPVEFSGGYFQVPDMVFDLPLAANEKLVLIYFVRRADRAGRSFPSVDRICRDCGFGSKNTALKVINGLVKAGLIHREPVPGRSHNYFVSRELCRVIEEAKGRYVKKEIASSDESAKLMRSYKNETLKQSRIGVRDMVQGDIVESRVKKTSPTPSEYEHPCSNIEPPGVQNMNPKEYTVEGSTEKEYTVKTEARKNIKRTNKEARASSSLYGRSDNFSYNDITLLDVADHMHSLTPQERKEFDREAQKLGKPGEPDPRESLWQRRLLRVRYLRHLRDGGG